MQKVPSGSWRTAADTGDTRDGRDKVIFAESPTQAEDLLCQVREPGPSGDD